MQTLNKLPAIFIAATILILIGITVYINFTPNPRDMFTEFYLLNADGRAADYPQQVNSGEPVRLLLGVVNHEMDNLSYAVKLINNGREIATYDIGRLPNGGKWEQVITFTPEARGPGQKYEFLLYSGDSSRPHIKDPLVLRLDIQ